VDIFESLKQFIEKSKFQVSGCVKICVLNHILSLKSHSENYTYFSGLKIENPDCIRDPFSVRLEGSILTVTKEK
jgi:hypothetical protein